MTRYKNLNGTSNVYAYQIGTNYITVQFSGTARTYTYSYGRAGAGHVETMKTLAQRGSGLNSYINKYVKSLYDK